MYDKASNLIFWEKAHQLTLRVYSITQAFPKEEQFGLTAQIRRAVVSIPSNVVEGKARGSVKDFKRFLLIARGSLEKTKYQLLLARDLNYIDKRTYEETVEIAKEVGKLLAGLIKSLG